MPNTSTANYNFTKPEIGGDSDLWGNHYNANWDAVDAKLKQIEDKLATTAGSSTDNTFSGNTVFQSPIQANGGVQGATDGSAAAAGIVGQFLSNVVAQAAAITVPQGTTIDVLSLSLPAGDWDVEGWVGHVSNTTLTASGIPQVSGGVSLTSKTVPQFSDAGGPCKTHHVLSGQELNAGASGLHACGRKRVSVNANTTVYLSVTASGFGGTLAAYGAITARRAR